MSTNLKVLFICRERAIAYGTSIGLVNSAQFIANFLNKCHIKSKVIMVKDANRIDAEVHSYKPSHVILNALWVTPEKLEVLAKKHPKIIWQIRIHSKIPFLAHEGNAISWLQQYKKLIEKCPNIEISGNSKEFCDAVNRSMKLHAIYLPNLYMPSYPAPKHDPECQEAINIGCFGAIRPFKNHLLQAMSAIHFGNKSGCKIRFHVNSSRTEQNGQQVLQNLQALFNGTNHELVEHEWMEHEEFLKLVAKMDLGMQVSISETYNIVAADFVYVGIPIVVSDEVRWMPFFSKADPHDIDSIVATLNLMYFCLGKIGTWMSKFYMRIDNQWAGTRWLNYLIYSNV